MARNVEIKARIVSVEALVPRAAAIAYQGPVEIVQDDTFFRCDSGRLKAPMLISSIKKSEIGVISGASP